MLHEQQPSEPGTVSRRKLIVTGATLAAAGVAVGAAAAIPFATNDDDTTGAASANPDKPVMVHLRSATEGTFDVFVGTDRVQLTDRAFAARLVQAVKAH
jgi:hypothetical protein